MEPAPAIGKKLQVQASGAKPVEAADSTLRPVSPEAHDLYLRGLSSWRARTGESLWEAVADFDKATTMDPDFAEAWAGLALAYAIIADYSTRISKPEAFRRGRDAVERALALDPGLPEAFASMGNIAYIQGRTDTGLELLRRATVVSPSFATAHQWLRTGLFLSGKPEEALAFLARRGSWIRTLPSSPTTTARCCWVRVATPRPSLWRSVVWTSTPMLGCASTSTSSPISSRTGPMVAAWRGWPGRERTDGS